MIGVERKNNLENSKRNNRKLSEITNIDERTGYGKNMYNRIAIQHSYYVGRNEKCY